MDIRGMIDAAHRAAREAASKLGTLNTEIRAGRDKLKARRRELLNAPEPAAALRKNADLVVERAGERFREAFGRSIVRNLSTTFRETSSGKIARTAPSLFELPQGSNPMEALCCFAPELVRKQLHKMIDAAGVEGMSAEDREAAIAAIDAEIVALEDDHLRLCDEAAKLNPPVAIDPIPEAVSRRRRERELREEREDISRRMQAAQRAHV